MKARMGLLLAVFLAFRPLQAAAEMQFFDAAAVSFPALAVPVGVRAIGMGDAYTAAGNDAYALNWNPAGLARLTGYELGLADNEWAPALGLRQQFVTYGQSWGADAGAALSLNYFALGQFDQRDSTGALQGRSSASMLAFSGGYGWSMLEQQRLKLGVALEVGTQTLYNNALTDFGGSLGVLYELPRDSSIGLSLNHLGTGAQGFSPPESLALGLATLAFSRQLTLALDAQLPFSSPSMLHAGFEYNISALSLRGGWRQALGAAESDVQSGFSAGVGVAVSVFKLDYAFVPYGELSNVHRVQATVQLPGNFFAARLSIQEGTSATAETFYKNAVALEKSGETLKALIQYQRSEESYPAAMKKKPQAFYVSAKKKIEELQAQMEKGGDHGQIQKLTKENIASAEKDIRAGRYKDAIEALLAAKKIDPGSQVIEKMLKDARKGLEEKLGVWRNAARFASNENNLSMSVENYKKLLGADSSDTEALAFFAKNRRDIKVMLQSAYRKGIFFYVGGNVEDALKTWTEAQALDYYGDIDFKRDIDKARKQLELRAKD